MTEGTGWPLASTLDVDSKGCLWTLVTQILDANQIDIHKIEQDLGNSDRILFHRGPPVMSC